MNPDGFRVLLWGSTLLATTTWLSPGGLAWARGGHGSGPPAASARGGRIPGPGPGPGFSAAPDDENIGPHGFRPEMIEEVAYELGLEQATVDVIKNKVYAARQEKIEARARLEHAHLELRRIMDEDKPDVAVVMKQVEKVGTLETDLKKIHVRLLLEIRGMLTRAQRDKLTELVKQRRGGPPGKTEPAPGAH